MKNMVWDSLLPVWVRWNLPLRYSPDLCVESLYQELGQKLAHRILGQLSFEQKCTVLISSLSSPRACCILSFPAQPIDAPW